MRTQEPTDARNKLLWECNDLIRYAGISRTRAYQLLKRDDLPVVHLGRRRYMNANKFREWLDQQTKG